MSNVTYLSNDEIEKFLDNLDGNGDGTIDYSEVERKLDEVHNEITPCPRPHNLHHATKKAEDRHRFLRSIIGSNKDHIPRAEFAKRVKEWEIPSLKQAVRKEEDEKAYMRGLSLWRKVRSYWSVHAPEILFHTLVASVVIASGTWKLVKYTTDPKYQQAFGWGIVLAKACAGALQPTFFFLILSMSRYLSTFLRKSYYISRFINWDLSQKFHITMSILALALSTLHAIGHLAGTYISRSSPSRHHAVAILIGPDAPRLTYSECVASLTGWTGLTALGLFCTLALLSMPQTKKRNYELFQLSHLLIYPIIALLILHLPTISYSLALPTTLILTERTTRLLLTTLPLPATLKILDPSTVEIRTKIPSERLWKYQPGQYVFLQVPALSTWQWHPFTISVCIGKTVHLHIKTDGNWTSRLRALAGPSGTAPIRIAINGPFGAPAQRFHDFTHTLVVGAGIGITPFAGILADLQTRAERARCQKRLASDISGESSLAEDDDDYEGDRRVVVDFHWLVHDRNALLWFSDLLNTVSRSQARRETRSRLDIRMHTHVTKTRADIAVHVYRWLLEMHRTVEHPESALTGLINPTGFGRPDWVGVMDEHYAGMRKYQACLVRKEREERERLRVGVFFCGPPAVGRVLADRCRVLTARGRGDGSGVEYFFMREVFG